LCLSLGARAGSVRVELRDDGFNLGNGFIERIVRLRPCLHTVSVKNLQTGREFPVESEEFLIALDGGDLRLTSRDFKPAGKPSCTDLSGGGKEVRCRLADAGHGVQVEVAYWISGESDFWTRKRLRVDAGDRLVNWIEVERFKFAADGKGDSPKLKRFDREKMPFPSRPWDITAGRPLYAGREVFLGLEYPAGHNDFDEDGVISLRHYPGRRGPILSRPAVIGVAPDRPCERLNDKFLEYIDRIRARPVKRSVQWVAYFHVGVSDELALEKMRVAKQTFTDRGVHLDCVLMDSGWTDGKSIMRISPKRPDRPGQIRDLARKYLNAGLGLHVITSGVKPMVDKDWLAEQGYDLIWHKSARDGAYCMGDPRVQKEFQSNLVRYVKDYDIAAYKFDWGYFNCGCAGHRGHLPGVEYGLEANADNFIKTLEALRAVKPDIFLFNTGWYSPWWLMYYDAIFSAGGDYNFSLASCPAFATCSALGTRRDAVVRGNLVQWSPFYPLSSLMHCSPINHWWHKWNARYKEPLDRFADYVLMSYLRGSQMTEIYLNIAALTDEHRDVLASIMNWAAKHDEVLLAGTRYIGGDPMAGEVYGYAHFTKDGRGIIGLRNPHVIPQKFELKLGEECGLRPTEGRHRLRTLYPYCSVLPARPKWGESVPLELPGHEVLVIEVTPAGGREEPPSPPRKTVAGTPEVRSAELRVAESAVTGRFEAAVPAGVRASLVLLAERRRLTARIWVNGKEVEPEAPHIQVEDSKEPARTYDGKVYEQRDACGLSIKGNWSLFRTPLPPGRDEVSFEMRCADLQRIRISGELKDGPARMPSAMSIPVRCMIQTEERLPRESVAGWRSGLPDRWADVLRGSVDVMPARTLELKNSRKVEVYTAKKGARIFCDMEAEIVLLPPEVEGCKGFRVAKAQAAKDAALYFSAAKPMRAVAAFGRDGAEGYLAPPPGWKLYRRDCFESTDPALGRDLYIRDMPRGDVTLFDSMRGAFTLVAVVQRPANLALGRPVSVQSSHDNRNLPAHVTDGYIRTEWWSANGLPQWGQVDLGEARDVNCVHVIFYHKDERWYQYKVETSKDGEEWRLACDATGNKTLSTADGAWHGFPRRKARFVRVTVTGGSRRVSAAHICELEVYDDPLSPGE